MTEKGKPSKKNQKYQIIKFDSFDFLIILILKKKFYRQTDRPTDRQTFGLIEATIRRLKRGSVCVCLCVLQKILMLACLSQLIKKSKKPKYFDSTDYLKVVRSTAIRNNQAQIIKRIKVIHLFLLI